MNLLNNLKYRDQVKNNSKYINECIWCRKYFDIRDTKSKIDTRYFCSFKCQQAYNKNKFQSFKNNNKCSKHPFQKLTFKNRCWGCYREKFYNNMLDILNYYKVKKLLFLKLKGFVFYPTFRTSEDSWGGDKIAFEQNLKDHNVKWFIYIKFCITDNSIKINKNFIKCNKNNFNKILLKNYLNDSLCPLVVGKSGSSLVNNSGSDLNFSINPKDGPAREYLKETNRKWCYDLIAIKKLKNQKQAYKAESKIMNKLNIFGS